MNLCDTFVAAKTDYRRVPTERLSHPKDGALAQQPKAERAPHSAVVRPQAAGKSRSTSPTLVSAFVSFAAGGSVFAMVIRQRGTAGRIWQRGQGTSIASSWRALNTKSVGLNQHARGAFFCFLVQDRLRASDVLHRDWDWSAMALISLRVPDEVAAELLGSGGYRRRQIRAVATPHR